MLKTKAAALEKIGIGNQIFVRQKNLRTKALKETNLGTFLFKKVDA